MRSALASFCVSFITLSSNWSTVFTVCGHILVLKNSKIASTVTVMMLSDVFLEMLFMC